MNVFFRVALLATVIGVSVLAGHSCEQEKLFNQEQALADLRKAISGRENEPAEKVFKNIRMKNFMSMPASRILRIMEVGYSKSLGVNCTHCHVAGAWEKDDVPTKRVARDMAEMSSKINTELLKNIKDLKNDNPVVNCTTCHRGQVKPATSLDSKP